ncbi:MULTISPECIES: ABC transporter permease [unclassified Shinella]|uniref:ABC transporter permease n=1 Tax=unclassified Shinella TaxID=2643062 RepID=UPI00225D85F9|nr:ABC transporter permease [Shinella sp. YE25]MDC7260136.1 ABC transporter permease [Shinella sp. YE25]CAI0341119.1 Branched-chain amino acid transport system / permease component family protein [Rhizobiaceae bacterium]CAK7262156.1 Branched-chain amino acid transport system / permease component family protein [Shinella sp. WSC3-e]
MTAHTEITPAQTDERLLKRSTVRTLAARPEMGAVAGLVLVVAYFYFNAHSSMFSLAGVITIMSPAAEVGILAVAAALLIISGEFDLSMGSMIAFAGLVFGVCLTVFELPFILSLLLTFACAALIGVVSGQIVVKTRLPSFIVTLAMLFVLRGLSLVGLKWATGGATQLHYIREAAGDGVLQGLFHGYAFQGFFIWLADNGLIAKFPSGQPTVSGIPVSILWLAVAVAVAAFLLNRTAYGNWIFASGGNALAASNCGVPVNQVKTTLFAFTACAAALVAILQVMEAGSTDAMRGFQKEFEAIIAAVIGGCLLSGGYGSVFGAFLGAVIFGTVSIGLTYTPIDTDWFMVFLGAMLLVAVFFNNFIRARVTGER